jgi:hypothetical protein
MPGTALNKSSDSNKIIFYFLLFWTIINAVQAYTLELQADEAYYWLYSKYLDWGYFDHPPMVAIFIRIGDSLLHTEFGLRLMTVLASTASIYLLWLTLKKYAVDAFTFALVISGIFIFHIYGFTTTPDSPLFFFTALFYFFYQRYIDKDKWWMALLLALTIACLLYSKYNAVLLIGFTLLANLKLLKRASFWFIVVVATALYIPHLLWEAQHGWPSVNYHLFERSADHYDFINSLSYLPAQLLMAGPLIGWFLFYKAFTTKIKDTFIRCLVVNCAGTLIFFFISSARGEVQPQWTFVLYAPLVMLALIHFKQQGGRPKWLLPVAITNLSIILIVRIIVIMGFGFARTYGHLKSYYGFKQWAGAIKQKAGDNYVIMVEGFQNPSKYDYYTNSLKCFAYDTRGYRLTQFDIWPMEDSLQHKKAYFLTSFPIKGISSDTMKLGTTGTWYGGWVNDVRTYQKVIFGAPNYKLTVSPGQRLTFNLTVTNPYPYTISFSNEGKQHPVVLEACFFKGDVGLSSQKAPGNFNDINLKPGASTQYTFTLTSPLEKGNFDLVFSLRTEPFPGSKNSRIIKLTVN